MNIMPFWVFVWRFDDGSTGVDIRVIEYLSQWLDEGEPPRLCSSLSRSRVIAFDRLMRDALT